MTTATETETRLDVLAELERHRAKVAEWAQKETALSREGMAAKHERQRLEDTIRQAIERDPELIDGEGRATSKANVVAKARAALEKVPDPEAVFGKRDHAAAVLRKAQRELDEFVAERFEEIHKARLQLAEEVRDEVKSHRDAHLAAAERYLAFAHETVHLTRPHPEYDGQSVAGIDEVSDLVRVLERLDDLPLPTIHGAGPEIAATPEPFLVETPKDEDE